MSDENKAVETASEQSAHGFAEPVQTTQQTSQELPEPEAKQGGMFGITTETKHTNNIPIPSVTQITPNPEYPNGYHFPKARLVNVVCNPELEKKDSSKVAVLQFIFKDKKDRQHIHTEWEIETTDDDWSKKINSMNERIKHIYVEAFGEKAFPSTGIGTTATTFKGFFQEVADAFNNMKDEAGNKVYSKGEYYLKLTFYKTTLGFPLSPPFLQRVLQNSNCILAINPKYDKIKPEETNNLAGVAGAGGAAIDPAALPDFNNAYQ